ncbi:MAG: hypothetical protein KKG00_08085, partial [Bacteroidetes bacterium]|nr:hypothetical protein [Bacteroidota bacterium]
LVLAGIYFKTETHQIRYTFRFLILTVIVFILLCPFLITDPLVILKSFFGGIMAKMQDKPMATYFNMEFIGSYFRNPINILISFVTLAGAWVLIKEKRCFHYILVGNWILFLFLVLRSAKIYDTHVLPAGIITLFTAGLGIAYLANLSGNKRFLLAGAILIPISSMNLYEYFRFQERSHTDSNMVKAYYWINTLPEDSRLLVHPELEFYLPKSRKTLAWDLEQNQDSVKMVRKLNYLMGNKGDKAIDEASLPYIARSFAFEDERLYEIQFQLLNKYNSKSTQKKFTYHVYLDNTELASTSVKTDEAIRDFREGKYDYMITDMRLEGLEPVKVFANGVHADTFIYRTDQNNSR